MERREFFKGLIAASLAVALAHKLIDEPKEERMEWREILTRKPGELVHTFKVSSEIVKAEGGVGQILDLIENDLKFNSGRKVTDIQIGFAGGDEFTKPDILMGIMTVVFKTVPA